MIIIREITAIETYTIRHPVLRNGKPIETCCFEGDDLTSTKHFGLFVGAFLVGVISLFKCTNEVFTAQNQFQIRGMAVLKNFQKKGYGEALIKKAESYLNQENKTFIWFNARETAVGFYLKSGYTVFGNPFEMETIGRHFLMFKEAIN